MADSEAIIGQGTFIRGNVRGDGDLNVAGRVEGTIEVRGEVVLEETSIIQSEVTADRIVVRGALAGDLHASDAVILEAGCKVVGDLDAPRIRIDEGALFRGRIEMGERDAAPAPAKKAAPQARVAPRAPARVAPAPRAPARVRAAEPPPEVEQEQQGAPPAPAPPPLPAPKARKPKSKAQENEAGDEGPPPPVVPALKKKSKGAVRKRGAR